MIPLYEVFKTGKFIETASTTVVPGVRERENGECFFGDDENVLEMDSGDGCIALQMYLGGGGVWRGCQLSV